MLLLGEDFYKRALGSTIVGKISINISRKMPPNGTNYALIIHVAIATEGASSI